MGLIGMMRKATWIAHHNKPISPKNWIMDSHWISVGCPMKSVA